MGLASASDELIEKEERFRSRARTPSIKRPYGQTEKRQIREMRNKVVGPRAVRSVKSIIIGLRIA